jgi:hypothetical protein
VHERAGLWPRAERGERKREEAELKRAASRAAGAGRRELDGSRAAAQGRAPRARLTVGCKGDRMIPSICRQPVSTREEEEEEGESSSPFSTSARVGTGATRVLRRASARARAACSLFLLRETLYASVPRSADSLSPTHRMFLPSYARTRTRIHITHRPSLVDRARRHLSRRAALVGEYIVVSAPLTLQNMLSIMGPRGSRAPNPFVRTFTLALLPHPLLIRLI